MHSSAPTACISHEMSPDGPVTDAEAGNAVRAGVVPDTIDPNFPQDTDTIERIVRRARLFDVDELAEWFETGEIDESKLPER